MTIRPGVILVLVGRKSKQDKNEKEGGETEKGQLKKKKERTIPVPLLRQLHFHRPLHHIHRIPRLLPLLPDKLFILLP